MKVGIVGGGILGLTLAYRLAARGQEVTVFEAAPRLGGLSCAHDYGPFVWDRFYHCILPTDLAMVSLVKELGLGEALRWSPTGTGYLSQGRLHTMNTPWDYLRFPLLGLRDKARLGAAVLYATRFADPFALYGVTAEAWLTRACGRRGYEAFWRPLLKAKFGTYHDKVAAVFIWATLKRLTGARSAAGAGERLGYVSGGYDRILRALEGALAARGATVRTSAPVSAVRPAGAGAEIVFVPQGLEGDARPRVEAFDQVLFTGPTRLAGAVADAAFQPHVRAMEEAYPTSRAYLGVACMVLALRRPLTSYYVLNLGDPGIDLTGVIEMTNLVDKGAETAGLSLVYLPQYMDSQDPRLDASDEALATAFLDRGLKRIFPDVTAGDIAYQGIHRARYVQPLPLVQKGLISKGDLPRMSRPFQILNTSLLSCATLNNNETVSLVDRFLSEEGRALGG